MENRVLEEKLSRIDSNADAYRERLVLVENQSAMLLHTVTELQRCLAAATTAQVADAGSRLPSDERLSPLQRHAAAAAAQYAANQQQQLAAGQGQQHDGALGESDDMSGVCMAGGGGAGLLGPLYSSGGGHLEPAQIATPHLGNSVSGVAAVDRATPERETIMLLKDLLGRQQQG
jgi:hypothetical protein